jgi:hypothetical protein
MPDSRVDASNLDGFIDAPEIMERMLRSLCRQLQCRSAILAYGIDPAKMTGLKKAVVRTCPSGLPADDPVPRVLS